LDDQAQKRQKPRTVSQLRKKVRVPSNTMVQLQLLRKVAPLALRRVLLENRLLGVRGCSDLLSVSSGGASRVVWWSYADEQWWSSR
jgi:hypothetical protein